jgi:uncharacterized protein (TIGR02300 family)
MASKLERGTKRTCQNPDCGARFYDLNRNPITCPICHSAYQLAVSSSAAGAAAPQPAAKPVRRPPRKPEVVADEGELPVVAEAPEPEVEEAALADVGEPEEAVPADEDETFLEEEEEDGSDMTNIIGGQVAEEDEEP